MHSERNPVATLSLAWCRTARLLVATMAVLLVVMPWTESHYHWDHFLRGGQDLELGLLTLAAVLCLVLLLCLHHGRVLSEWFHLSQLFSSFHRQMGTFRDQGRPEGMRATCARDTLLGPARSALPMRI